jgi:hypothetical protein
VRAALERSGGSALRQRRNSPGGSAQSVRSASAAIRAPSRRQPGPRCARRDLRAPAAPVASISIRSGVAIGSQSGSSSADASEFIVHLFALAPEAGGLSESDIGKVKKEGQKATVTVNAASGEEVAAHVSSIVLSSSDGGSAGGTAALTLQRRRGQLRSSSRSIRRPTASRRHERDGLHRHLQASGVMVPGGRCALSPVTLVSNGGRDAARRDKRRGRQHDGREAG